MPCYEPLLAYDLGIKPNGKRNLKIVNRNTLTNFNKTEWYRRDVHGNYIKVDNIVLLPCGQCIGCRIDYSRNWANRMMQEAQYHEQNSFITLTYDNENLPLAPYMNLKGDVCTSMTLVKKHFQLFMKRLRKKIGDVKIRYYACGEYGDQSLRPHYHAIIFGYDFPDRELLKNVNGNPYYTSELLQDVWPYGFSMVCNVSWQTCAYVARYVVKKRKGKDKEFYEMRNIEPEFVLMSRKPGIGRQWYEDNKDKLYEFDKMHVSTHYGGIMVKPCRYYDGLYDEEKPSIMETVRGERMERADNISSQKLRECDYRYLDMLQAEGKQFEDRIKALSRNGV